MATVDTTESMKLSKFARITVRDDGSYELGTRSEHGRGKRFGSSGRVTLTQDELDALAKWYVEHRYPFAF